MDDDGWGREEILAPGAGRDELLDPAVDDDPDDVGLRPRRLDDFVGQSELTWSRPA